MSGKPTVWSYGHGTESKDIVFNQSQHTILIVMVIGHMVCTLDNLSCGFVENIVNIFFPVNTIIKDLKLW